MINVTKDTRIPSVDEVLNILTMYNAQNPQYIDYDKLMMNLSALSYKVDVESKNLSNMIGMSNLVSPKTMMQSYIESHNCSHFFDTVTTGISFSKDSVEKALDNPEMPAEVKKVVLTYQNYQGMLKARSTLVSLLQNPLSDKISCDNHRMIELHPEWSPQNTGRVAMKYPAVQNLPRGLQELITVPKGYHLIHTDSGQIEPRVIYSAFVKDKQIQTLINLYDDAYFGLVHYVTMPQGFIESGTLDFNKMEITEELQNKRKKIKTYGNAVMYGSTSNVEHDPIKAAMIERIGKHPLRQRWVETVERKLNMGQTIFQTAFGTNIDISKSEKLSGNIWSADNRHELVKLAINNPIQGTAADLMRLSVMEAHRILMKECNNSYIINYVHDAGTFAIADEDIHVADKIGDIVCYNIEGWLPIKADAEIYQWSKEGAFVEYAY